MPPKKKEEVVLAPEECLPEGYTVGCEVYWTGDTKATEEGGVIKCGDKARIASVYPSEEHTVEFVDVEIDEGNTIKVPFDSLSLEPPSPDQMDELDTGLRLPLKGRDLRLLWDAKAVTAQLSLLTQLLFLDEVYPEIEQREIVADFHVCNVRQAQQLSLTPVQAATFVAIMTHVLAMIRRPDPAPNPADCSECYKEFMGMIINHASDSENPKRIGIFGPTEARALTDFAGDTFFKHFLLYQYCVNYRPEPQSLIFHLEVERPPAPPGPVDMNNVTSRNSKGLKDRGNYGSAVSRGTDRTHSDHPGGADAGAEGAAGEQTGELTEEGEMHRMVEERLRATKEALRQKLADRQKAFEMKLEGMPKKNKKG